MAWLLRIKQYFVKEGWETPHWETKSIMWVSLAGLECCSAEMDKVGCWVYQGRDLPGGAEGKGGCWKKVWLMWWAMTSKLERKRSEGRGMLVHKEKVSGWPMDFKSWEDQPCVVRWLSEHAGISRKWGSCFFTMELCFILSSKPVTSASLHHVQNLLIILRRA